MLAIHSFIHLLIQYISIGAAVNRLSVGTALNMVYLCELSLVGLTETNNPKNK